MQEGKGKMSDLGEREGCAVAEEEVRDAARRAKHLGIAALICGVVVPPAGVALGIAALVCAVRTVDALVPGASAKPGVVMGLLGIVVGFKMGLLEALVFLSQGM